MQLDLSNLQVPAKVPVVPVGPNSEREPENIKETLVNQGIQQLVPVVPVVPVDFNKVHAKPDHQHSSEQAELRTPDSRDWWASYEAMTNETPAHAQPATAGRKSPQEQTIAEWVAEYEAAEQRYREIDL